MRRFAVFLIGCCLSFSAHAQEMVNHAYITLSGTVASIASGDEFWLDYGGGMIKVDTNDAWPNLFKRDAYNINKVLQEGDRVWVSGRIDDHWFRERELDAYTLRHEASGEIVVYTPKPAKEREKEPYGSVMPAKGMVVVTGLISKVMGPHAYLLQYGSSPDDTIRVNLIDVDGVSPNAYKVGDHVVVTGRMGRKFLVRRELSATEIRPVATASGGLEG